jgi:alcohol dehydrogenase (cytochrome c)
MRLPPFAIAIVSLALCAPRVWAAQGVSYEQLVHADEEPQNWLMYGGDYQSRRFSELRQINRQNVAQLRPAWIYQRSEPGEMIEDSPVVVDGIMYVVEPPTTVTALDARTGLTIWSWSPNLPKRVVAIGLHQTSRGVAVLGDMVYVGTIDAHLVALDRRSGAVRWDVTLGDNKEGYAITSAPMAINGKIIVGPGGGEAGARGFIDAYDAQTGKRLWRLYTIPLPGEPGSETWAGAQILGGLAWNKGSYDPELNLLYWGTGNPAPDYNGDARTGDNLYTCSLLAIDADTGTLKWHFQYSPHDTHDWDGVQVPVLFEGAVNGKPRKLLSVANRNGFYYVLDRVTGEFVAGAPFIKQTWAQGLDAQGRPIVIPNTDPGFEPVLVYPSNNGGVDWVSPAYSPLTKLFYVSAREMGAYFAKAKLPDKPLQVGTPLIMGGAGNQYLSGDDSYGAIRALEVATGKMKWEFRLDAPAWVAPLATAGGLVFSGDDEGNFFAMDAETGKPLWHFRTGGSFLASDTRSSPITYEVDGKQYVEIASGDAFIVFSLR